MGVDSNWFNIIRQLGKQRTEAEEIRFTAGGAFRANGEVSSGEEAAHGEGVTMAVTGETDGGDGGKGFGHSAKAVGDDRNGAEEGVAEEDGVEKGAMVADVEDAGGGGVGNGAALDHAEINAKGGPEYWAEAVRKKKAGNNAEEAQEDGEGEVEKEGERGEGCGEKGKAAVMEDWGFWVFFSSKVES